jgi:hypothetical protein
MEVPMNNRMKMIAVSVVFGSLASFPAFAQTADTTAKRDEVVKARELRQEKRIEQGVKNGSLTQQEAAKLEKQEAKINADEAKALADGKMSKKEFRKIEREQNRESRRIARKKHS